MIYFFENFHLRVSFREYYYNRSINVRFLGQTTDDRSLRVFRFQLDSQNFTLKSQSDLIGSDSFRYEFAYLCTNFNITYYAVVNYKRNESPKNLSWSLEIFSTNPTKRIYFISTTTSEAIGGVYLFCVDNNSVAVIVKQYSEIRNETKLIKYLFAFDIAT